MPDTDLPLAVFKFTVLTVATVNKNKFCKIIYIRISHACEASSGKQIPFHGFENIEGHLAS